MLEAIAKLRRAAAADESARLIRDKVRARVMAGGPRVRVRVRARARVKVGLTLG